MPPCKGHKKSRAGCVQCKQRHVKCDEQHPACLRCIAASRHCEYTGTAPFPSSQDVREIKWPDQNISSARVCLTPMSLFHLRLFHNFEHHAAITTAMTSELNQVYCKMTTERGFQVPFVMQTCLAISALHMSLLHEDADGWFKRSATLLQTQALKSFEQSGALTSLNANNVIDVVIFQHLTALHAFCDLFTSPPSKFNDLLDGVCRCMQLLRGVNSVIIEYWHALVDTELGTLMREARKRVHAPRAQGTECQALHVMLDQSQLPTEIEATCRGAVVTLQACIDLEKDLQVSVKDSTNLLFTWCITMDAAFAELLREGRPETLAVLSHFAVLLHARRESWIVQNSGRLLLEAISKHLGVEWSPLLWWPCQIVLGDGIEKRGGFSDFSPDITPLQIEM